MNGTDPLLQALLDSLDAPQLLLNRRRVAGSNQAARSLLGEVLVGGDVSLVLRHPRILELVQRGDEGAIDVRGIGVAEREWRVVLKPLSDGLQLLRLEDLSAARGAERIRTDFVANASHELRTPLASIIGYAETLADDEDGDLPTELRAKFSGSILREGKRVLRLVDELMSLSRISADRYLAPTGTVDLVAVIEQAIIEHRDVADACNGEMLFAPPATTAPVVGDRSQIAQLVDNLLSNALRYGGRDGHCRVEIGLETDGDDVRLQVRDEGKGIEIEHLPRLTERFYRVDPARSRESGGTGLGLAIVKHIVERHRGTLDIASIVGKGTTVTVRLRAAQRE